MSNDKRSDDKAYTENLRRSIGEDTINALRDDPPPKRVAAQSKTLNVSAFAKAEATIEDVQHVGDGDQWKLLSKAWSDAEGWMKSTKAMYIERMGCLVQVTTQQGDMVAEALTFVPGVMVVDDVNGGRRLDRISNR